MYGHMEGLLMRLQHTEESLDERLVHLETQLRTQVRARTAYQRFCGHLRGQAVIQPKEDPPKSDASLLTPPRSYARVFPRPLAAGAPSG